MNCDAQCHDYAARWHDYVKMKKNYTPSVPVFFSTVFNIACSKNIVHFNNYGNSYVNKRKIEGEYSNLDLYYGNY